MYSGMTRRHRLPPARLTQKSDPTGFSIGPRAEDGLGTWEVLVDRGWQSGQRCAGVEGSHTSPPPTSPLPVRFLKNLDRPAAAVGTAFVCSAGDRTRNVVGEFVPRRCPQWTSPR
jgi:hypothetical protein